MQKFLQIPDVMYESTFPKFRFKISAARIRLVNKHLTAYASKFNKNYKFKNKFCAEK